DKIRKSIGGHYFIYGSVEQRNDPEASYFIRTENLIFHPELTKEVQQKFERNFLAYWLRLIKFENKFDFQGFTISADLILLRAKHILGATALMSGKLHEALRLHESVEQDLKRINPLPDELIKLREIVINLIGEENFLIARSYFIV